MVPLYPDGTVSGYTLQALFDSMAEYTSTGTLVTSYNISSFPYVITRTESPVCFPSTFSIIQTDKITRLDPNQHGSERLGSSSFLGLLVLHSQSWKHTI